MFCFPYAGGGAAVFRAWNAALPDAIEVCPVQLPGRETRAIEPAYSRIEPLLEALVAELRPFLDLPYVFFGYSMGAIVAFELARTFAAHGNPGPLHLFLGARRAPRFPDPYPKTEKLSSSAFIRELRTMGGTPSEILGNPDLLQVILPTLRADFALCENYTYLKGALVDCPLTVYGGKNDLKVTEEALAAWCTETRFECRVKMFAGDHFFIHTCQAVLLQDILQVLSESVAV